MAHEINTPVGVGLTASSHMLEKIQAFESINDAGRLTKADLQRFLSDSHRANDIILGNLRRAADLVHSFKQIATDQATETRREFNLADYVDEVLMNLHPRLGKTQIKVAVSCPHEFVIDSYPGALAQVLTNLLINSLEHAFEENSPGQIHMQFTLSAGNRLSVQYRDNGRGIPEASRAKIFEPFFTTRRHQGGTGLGLNIVFNIVTGKLNGSIRLDEKLPVGIGFLIEFPIEIKRPQLSVAKLP